MLSGIEPGELVRAIRQSDVARLTRIPGIGRKTAERLALELKDRMPDATGADVDAPDSSGDSVRDDVMSALINLGYQRPVIQRALDRAMKAATSHEFEPLLRDVLKTMTGG